MENISNTYSSFPVPKDAWDLLSLPEKSEMMKVAIKNGITNLQDIRDSYNEFSRGGYVPSKAIKDRISFYEGKAMTGAKDPITGKWGKNNSFENEAAKFYSVLPESIREQVLSNQDLADNLYSYSYNVGAGNFRKRVVPALERYYSGEGSIRDVENSMWASNDSKLKGLQRRRAEEKEGVRNALLGNMGVVSSTNQEPFEFIPSNPQAFFNPYLYQQADIIPEPPVYKEEEVNPYFKEELEKQDRRQRLNALSMVLGMSNPYPTENNSMLNAIGLLTGSSYAKGGSIHIKPENRGKFTRLKERTGHSASWFKAHGTPAQKKMATFALNARKWKHGDGGPLSNEQYYSIMERVAEENNPIWNQQRAEEGRSPLTIDEEYLRILNDNSYDYRGYYNKYPQSRANADTHWTDEFKTVYHPTFSNQSIYSGKKSQFNPEGLPGGMWVGETFLPKAWQVAEANKYANGGHIYDGTSQPTQQMNNGKVLVTNSYGDNYYIDPRQVNSTEWNLTTPEVSVTANPDDVARGRAERWFRDFGTESNDATSVAGGRKQNSHLDEWGIEGAAKAATWAKDHPVLNNIGLAVGATPFAVASYPAAVGGGELTATALANPYVDAGLTSYFGAHGLQKLANGEANWMTALELAPLGRLAKPLYESTFNIVNSAYNKLPWTYRIPENPNMAYRRMGPLERDWIMKGNELSTRETNALTEAEEEVARAASKKGRRFSLFKAGAEHGGRKQFAKGQPWKGTTVTHGEEQVLAIPGKGLPWVSGRHYRGPQGNSFGVGDVSFEEAPFGSHIDLLTKKGYSGVNPSLLDGSIIYSPYKIFGHNFGYKKLYPNSQITAENAASMTSEQWTAAQDAAIARGDMAEAQRLRDLHSIVAKQDNPVKGKTFAHSGYEDYNVFDESKFGQTDEGYHGKGFYFANTRVPEDPSIYMNLRHGKMTFGSHGEIPTMNYGPIKKYYYLYGDKTVPGGNPETNFFGTNDIAIVSKRNFESGKPTEIIVGKPNHIKLANAVTYDNNGVRIPLGERDNFSKNDTRYSWLAPFIGLGTAGTLYGKQE